MNADVRGLRHSDVTFELAYGTDLRLISVRILYRRVSAFIRSYFYSSHLDSACLYAERNANQSVSVAWANPYQ
jgi:hypothetical protein